MIHLYADANVPGELVRALRNRGVDITRVQEDEADDVGDSHILARATLLGRTVITHDRDFLAIASQWLRIGRHFSGVVLLTHPSNQLQPTLAHIEILALAYDPSDMENHIEFIPFPGA